MVGPDSSTNRAAEKPVEPLLMSGAGVETSVTPAPSSPSKQRPSTLPPAEMAEHDLDASLQLLAERAQYITGATAAAIALRRGAHKDMLCRASTGASAPALGTLLSMEYGFTGESVSTRQTLFCSEAETDARVNREGCRQLGIASVIAMPIMSGEEALGVFELFSGKPRAFGERDFAALRRLSGLVEIAVKHAAASQNVAIPDIAGGKVAGQPETFESTDTISLESSLTEVKAADARVSPSDPDGAADTHSEIKKKTKSERSAPTPPYWSIALRTESAQSPPPPESSEAIPVPAVLRDLQKCQACGFPVSQGRTLCVECEEKQWRGRLIGRSNPAGEIVEPQRDALQEDGPKIFRTANPQAAKIAVSNDEASATAAAPHRAPEAETRAPVLAADGLEDHDRTENSELFLSVNAHESWLAANRLALSALLLIAIIIAAIIWLR